MTAVGDGKVDVAAGLPSVLAEYDGDPLEALARSYRYLVAAGLSRGRGPA